MTKEELIARCECCYARERAASEQAARDDLDARVNRWAWNLSTVEAAQDAVSIDAYYFIDVRASMERVGFPVDQIDAVEDAWSILR